MKKIVFIFFSSLIIFSCSKKKNTDENTSNTSDTVATYSWITEACEYTGEYNPQVTSKEQLDNTYELWFGSSLLNTDATVFEPEDIKKLNTDTLTQEYSNMMNKYKTMKIVSIPFWEKLKEKHIQELQEEYKLKKITIEAYSNPSILIKNEYTQYCTDYAKILASNKPDEMLKAWKKLAEEQKLKNGSPDEFMKEFYIKYNSKDKLLYAKVELMAFGWWNCANEHITRTSRDSTDEQEFQKLFKNIKSQCDEP